MGKKDGEKKMEKMEKMDSKAMLEAFIAKFGIGVIVKDIVGDANPDMTLFEFMNSLEEKGVADIVMDMTLGELFGVKPKATDQGVLKDNILELLGKKTDLTVSQIAEELGETGNKNLSVAMAALKKAGKVASEGEKRNMRYSLPA